MKFSFVLILAGGLLWAVACAHVSEAELKLPVLSGYEKFYGDKPQFALPEKDPCEKVRASQTLSLPPAESSPQPLQAQEALLINEKTAMAALSLPDLFCQELLIPQADGPSIKGRLVAHEAAARYEGAALEALKAPGVYRQTANGDAAEKTGLTVAHLAVSSYKAAALYALDYPGIYRLAQPETAGKNAGYTVAHAAAEHFESAALYALHFPLIYRLRQHVSAEGRYGWTVAHLAVWSHERAAMEALKDPNVYYLALPASAPEYSGYSVAHFAVMRWPEAARYALTHPTIPGISDGKGFLVGTLARRTLEAEKKAASLPPEEAPQAEDETQIEKARTTAGEIPQ